jgi:hypothetical protein
MLGAEEDIDASRDFMLQMNEQDVKHTHTKTKFLVRGSRNGAAMCLHVVRSPRAQLFLSRGASLLP